MRTFSPNKRLALVLLGTGAALVAWRLARHLRIPMSATEIDVPFTTASPHKLDARVFAGDTPPQFIRDGVGALFYRRYSVDIAHVRKSKEGLMAEVRLHLNQFSPSEIAIFQKTSGEKDDMQVGDDYFIHIASPWNGPVRVIEVTPTSFSFITLVGHFEAGEIQFRLIDHPDDPSLLRFEIRSWSRSAGGLVNFFYDKLTIIKNAQTRMWVYFCQHVGEMSGGEVVGKVQVVTHRVPYQRYQQQFPKGLKPWQQYKPRLEYLRRAKLNFDLDKREEYIEANGWRIDHYSADLPDETAGEPHPDGAWEQAKRVLLNYEFPDPALISGIFVPDDPLDQRVMLLEAKFLRFTFYFGARIGTVIDEERDDPQKGRARVWGYSYRTLEGHFEMGEITFEIWKFLQSGKVEFRIHAYSKTDRIRNPLYRLGFAIFGRRLQRRFAATALTRMQEIVTNRLAGVAQPVETPEVKTTSAEEIEAKS
jgi:uncharacterized protein (UPF0548 family)